jgi:amidophosphoribosyltransferase
MCGIAGILVAEGTQAVASLYEALLALQHRGQDAAGIVTEDNGRLCLHKDNGMVRDVFQQESINKLTGSVGIGHVRYPTAGSSCSSEAQPFYVNNPFGISLAHNGNLVNCDALKKGLRKEWRHINTGSDSEVLLNILAAALLDSLSARSASPVQDDVPPATKATDDDILYAARLCMNRCVGGCARAPPHAHPNAHAHAADAHALSLVVPRTARSGSCAQLRGGRDDHWIRHPRPA